MPLVQRGTQSAISYEDREHYEGTQNTAKRPWVEQEEFTLLRYVFLQSPALAQLLDRSCNRFFLSCSRGLVAAPSTTESPLATGIVCSS